MASLMLSGLQIKELINEIKKKGYQKTGEENLQKSSEKESNKKRKI